VIVAVEQSFGRWRQLPHEQVDPIDPLIVDLVVHPAQINDRDTAARSATILSLASISARAQQPWLLHWLQMERIS
jgi:hypothetical protein